MPKKPLRDKPESVRLSEAEARWLDEWVRETRQDRSSVMRAGVRLLRTITRDLTFGAKVRLIARLSDTALADLTSDEVEVWAAQAARAMKQIESRRGSGRG